MFKMTKVNTEMANTEKTNTEKTNTEKTNTEMMNTTNESTKASVGAAEEVVRNSVVKCGRTPLKSGGELVVGSSGRHIEYFFPGPDKRYGGVHITIPGEQITDYISAWKENFARYSELKAENDRKNVVETGRLRMVIRTGYMEGVYLRGNHMRVTREEQLEQIVKDYESALDTQDPEKCTQ